jgi:hypothetical protein
MLDIAAWIGLFAGILFWGQFFFTLLAPTNLLDSVYASVMSVGYAIVLPMLLSTLVPSTPAGQLLQRTRWRTIGFVVTIGATLYMAAHAFSVQWAWWAAKPSVAETQQDLWLAIGSCIVFILVPALAWVQAAPDRWVAEVRQSHAVARLRTAQEANLMLMKAQYIRALSIMRRGLANATAAERSEVAQSLIAFQTAENEALGAIVDSLETITGIAMLIDLPEDREEVVQAYTGITQQLGRLITPPNSIDYVELTNAIRVTPDPTYDEMTPSNQMVQRPVAPHQEASHRDSGHGPAIATVTHSDARQRTAAPTQPTETYTAFATTAAQALPGTFTAKRLAEAIAVSESQAREMIAAWLGCGWVDKTNLRGHYCWRETTP